MIGRFLRLVLHKRIVVLNLILPAALQVPSDLEVGQVPQMVVLTFNGAVNIDNINIYQQIFREDFINPNGCQIKGTFFVSHKYTNYSAVQVSPIVLHSTHHARKVKSCGERVTRARFILLMIGLP